MSFRVFLSPRLVLFGIVFLMPALAHAQQYPGAANFPLCTVGTASGGSPSQYCLGPADIRDNMQIQQMGFQRSDGEVFWVGGPTTFNIASAATVNSTVGNYLSGIKLPNGTYPIVRAVLSLTQQLQGSAVTVNGSATVCGGDGIVHTGVRQAAPGESCTSRGVSAPYQSNVPADSGCLDSTTNYNASTLTTPMVVSNTSGGSLNIGFNISGGIMYQVSGGVCTFFSPGWPRPTLVGQ